LFESRRCGLPLPLARKTSFSFPSGPSASPPLLPSNFPMSPIVGEEGSVVIEVAPANRSLSKLTRVDAFPPWIPSAMIIEEVALLVDILLLAAAAAALRVGDPVPDTTVLIRPLMLILIPLPPPFTFPPVGEGDSP